LGAAFLRTRPAEINIFAGDVEGPLAGEFTEYALKHAKSPTKRFERTRWAADAARGLTDR
jgi:hypothetical protein